MANESDNTNISPDERHDAGGNGELVRCMQERQDYLTGWQRAKADFVNYKNDEARRLEDTARFITRSLVTDILPVLDSFDLACEHWESRERSEQEVKGILLIRSQLLDALKKRGVEVIPFHAGDMFDPALHEALGEVESDVPEGTIAEEFQKGYVLQGNVVRPARVRLAK